MASKAELQAELTDLLRKQGKQQRRKQKNDKGSKRYRRAKVKFLRMRGKIEAIRAELARRTPPRQKAVAWAMSQIGVSEHPDGSNWGVPVQNWIKDTGYASPVPWCGCFVYQALKRAGAKIPTPIRLGYHLYIKADAEAGRNGLKAVPFSEAREGDIIVFSFGHIAIARGKSTVTTVPTCDGNTSPTNYGSQANGGCVAPKVRNRGDVICVARVTSWK